MEKLSPAFVLFAAALLLFGCLQSQPGEQVAGDSAQAQSGFSVPYTQAKYVAHYILSDESGEITKTVYRSDRRMRIALGSALGGRVELFLLGNKAYSCAAGSCLDITGRTDESTYAPLFSPPDTGSSEFVEEVEIGSITGKCYASSYPPYGTRKFCFTPDGILAYDSYEQGKTSYTEYMTSLSYGVSEADFALPYEIKQQSGASNKEE